MIDPNLFDDVSRLIPAMSASLSRNVREENRPHTPGTKNKKKRTEPSGGNLQPRPRYRCAQIWLRTGAADDKN